MHQIWKRKKWVLITVAILMGMLATESAWGLSEFWHMASLQEIVIMVDAGHGGSDPGAVDTGILEKDLNLAIAQKLQGYLEEAGYSVNMTRLEDVDLGEAETAGSRKQADMQERKRLIQESRADLMISIHQNAYPDRRFFGPQVFYQKKSPEAAALALLVQAELNSFTAPESNRKIKPDDSYFILKNAPMPAILVECGFITHSKEAENLQDDSYQKKVAWGIYCGIEKYLQSESF